MKQIFCLIAFLSFYFTTYAQKIVFTPHWVAQGQFAGFYVADSLGYYQDEGLDVEIVHPTTSKTALSHLKAGTSQIITSNLSHALSFNSEGEDIVNIMQLSQAGGLMLVSHIPLKDINCLRNKKVGVWTYIDPKLLDLMNLKFGLNIEWVRFNSGINVFHAKALDIVLVSDNDEFHTLNQCGVDIDSIHMFRLSEHGYDVPEEGIYVTREYYLQNKEVLDRFLRATRRGWDWTNENLEETVDIVIIRNENNSVATNRYHQRMMLKVTLKSHVNINTGTRPYRLNEQDYDRVMDLFSLIYNGGAAPKYQDFVK